MLRSIARIVGAIDLAAHARHGHRDTATEASPRAADARRPVRGLRLD